uniref:BHLH domain-containing protein n=1 Tax=Graphocephala atropunctata TaxID=36148 RepID=A0A1B6KRS9_9HEMI
MSTLSRSEEKVRLEDLQHYDQDDIGYCSLERPDSPTLRSHHGSMEQEKRIRREIANSNERRRMQSINAGFQSLRTLLPHHEGEKLSKAAILQQTAEYIYQLEQEKTRLLSQNCQLKRLINQHEGEPLTTSAAKKRKTETGLVVSVADEVITSDGAMAVAGAVVNAGAGSPTLLDIEQAGANSELIDLRVQLDRERGLRMILEDQVRSLETQLYPERIREITQQVQLQFSQQQQEDDPLAAGLLTPLRRESQSSTGSESVGQEAASAVATLQVVSAASLQPVSLQRPSSPPPPLHPPLLPLPLPLLPPLPPPLPPPPPLASPRS